MIILFSVSMVSVCLPSDALLQQLPSHLGFSYLGRGVSLHGCSSKAQPLLLTLDEGYLLTATLPDLQLLASPIYIGQAQAEEEKKKKKKKNIKRELKGRCLFPALSCSLTLFLLSRLLSHSLSLSSVHVFWVGMLSHIEDVFSFIF